MSQDTLDRNSYRPHVLPEHGEELIRGWQYLLTPLVREILEKRYGYYGIPTVVECLLIKTPPMRIEIMKTNLATGVSQYSIQENAGQEATFRVFMGVGRPVLKFALDFVEIEKEALTFDGSFTSKEDDWFDTKNMPIPSDIIRTRPTRWFQRDRSLDRRGSSKISVPRTSPRPKADLSIFL